VIIHVILFYPNTAIYSRGGLLNDAWFIMISQIVVNPILNVLNPWLFWTFFKKSRLRKKVASGTAGDTTQLEAHQMFELPVWDPSFCYAGALKDVMTCIFFQPILPLGPFLGIVSAFLMYWSQKYRLLRQSVRPISLTTAIAAMGAYLLSLGPLVYGVRVG